MLKIVNISVHEKKSRYYRIEFMNDKGHVDELSVHEDVFVIKSLRKGLEMTDEDFHDLIQMESKNGAYQAAIRYLGYRMRTIKEMHDYLLKKGFEPRIVSEIISRLTNENLLNDQSFAESFVRSRMNTSDKGPAYILNELRQKGILDDVASLALSEYSSDHQYKNALHFAKKKMGTSSSTSHSEKLKKVAASLVQKGFDREIITEVLKVLPEEDLESEWNALQSQASKAEWKFRNEDGRTQHYKIRNFLYRKGFSRSVIERYFNNKENLQ